MNKLTFISLKLDNTLDVIFVLMSTLASFAILEGLTTVLSVVVLVANLIYILPKTKREISVHYRNSIKRYIKQFFSKNSKYE